MNPNPEPTPAWRWPVIRLRWALLAGAFFFVNALRLALTVALDLRASGSHTPWQEPMVWELSSGFLVWALLPLAQAAALNAPWKRVSWRRFIGIHLSAALVFWILHVAGMWSLRMAVYRVAGWGAYDYGDMLFRAPMEGVKDLLSFAGLEVARLLCGQLELALRVCITRGRRNGLCNARLSRGRRVRGHAGRDGDGTPGPWHREVREMDNRPRGQSGAGGNCGLPQQ